MHNIILKFRTWNLHFYAFQNIFQFFINLKRFFSFISDSFPLKKAPLPYGRRASIIGAYFTFTVTFTDLFPDFTVTFAVPFFFPVTTPFLETVTIFLLEVV